jgi:ATP-binding cassette subfamily B protein RaxB
MLFLDEGTAHLDVATERVVSENLRRLNITRISVAHRPDIASGADRIIRVARTIQPITAPPALIENGRSTAAPPLSSA